MFEVSDTSKIFPFFQPATKKFFNFETNQLRDLPLFWRPQEPPVTSPNPLKYTRVRFRARGNVNGPAGGLKPTRTRVEQNFIDGATNLIKWNGRTPDDIRGIFATGLSVPTPSDSREPTIEYSKSIQNNPRSTLSRTRKRYLFRMLPLYLVFLLLWFVR